MRDWAEETGSAPMSYEWCPGSARALGLLGPTPTKFELERDRWPGNTTVYRVFESWSAALHTAGLRASRRAPVRGTVAERVDQARALTQDGLTTREIADHLGVEDRTVERYLNASSCTTCGSPVVGKGDLCRSCAVRESNPRTWTEDQLLAAALAWLRETGRHPTLRDWVPGHPKWDAEAPRWPTIGAVKVTFGGFQELRLAQNRLPYNAPWDRESVIAAIGVFVQVNGRVPTKQEWEAGAGDRYPSASTVHRLFGGWTAGLRAAGQQGAGAQRLWDRPRIIAAIQAFERVNRRPPRYSEWVVKAPGRPSSGTVVNRFGSFPAALAAARIEPQAS